MEMENDFNLPKQILDRYKEVKNIKNFYEWQKNCLSGIHDSNIVLSVPTSGGKTLIAEINMLKCILQRKKNVLIILPFITLVHEYMKCASQLGEIFKFKCVEYANNNGTFPPIKFDRVNCVYICTIEKAYLLIKNMLESDRLLSEVGLIIADELHMLSCGARGALYESTLSLCTIINEKSDTCKIQIIGMSATLENKEDVAEFLSASIFESSFRPKAIREYVKLNECIYTVNYEKRSLDYVRKLKFDPSIYPNNDSKQSDPDCLAGLVNEKIPHKSVLIFCNTKRSCENVAKLLFRLLPQEIIDYKSSEKKALYDRLKPLISDSLRAILFHSIKYGIAIHHSGLSIEERKLIEEAFKEGIICVLTCTSTLAAGVNLPANFVIIRSPYLGSNLIEIFDYKQMIGRSGRSIQSKITIEGESIMIVNRNNYGEELKVKNLLFNSKWFCESAFNSENFKSIKSIIILLISLKIATTNKEIQKKLQHSLYYIQKRKSNGIDLYSDSIKYLLSELISGNFIKIVKENENEALLEIQQLGSIFLKGTIEIETLLSLYEVLKSSINSVNLSSFLNLIMICTTIENASLIARVEMETFSRVFFRLSEFEKEFCFSIGINEKFFEKNRTESLQNGSIAHRLYVALILNELWIKNTTSKDLVNIFKIDIGILDKLSKSCLMFLRGLVTFCNEFEEFKLIKCLFESFLKYIKLKI